MNLGFVGTGTIAAAMVTGLRLEGAPGHRILLSPRNAAVAADLSSRFRDVSICGTNQEVVDQSDTVVLAIRPQVAEEILSGLRFRGDQVVVSLVAGFSTRRIGDLVAPAHRIWRAIPLPSVARRRSPIAVHPAGGPAAELFAPLGQVFGIENEDHLNAVSSATSTMAAYFGFVGRIASWMSGKGLPEPQCREYLALMFAGLGEAGLEASRKSFEELAVAHATPGGLNEQVFRDLADGGAYDTLAQALDSVHRRAEGKSA